MRIAKSRDGKSLNKINNLYVPVRRPKYGHRKFITINKSINFNSTTFVHCM